MTRRVALITAAILLTAVPIDAVIDDAEAQQSVPASTAPRLVFPNGRTSGLSGAYWEAALANGGPAPRQERLLVVMPDGRVVHVIDGEHDRVKLPLEMSRTLSEQKLQVTLVHNHLSGASLSGADLAQLAKIGVASVVAVGRDGSVYEASAGSRYDLFADDFYPLLVSRVQERLETEAWRDHDDPAAVLPHLSHLVAVVLHRARIIDYRATPSLTAWLAFARFRELFERVIAPEVRKLEQELPTAGR